MGAILDQRGMREITLTETDDGFVVQGLALLPGADRQRSDPTARLAKETFFLREDDISRFMDEGLARRQAAVGKSPNRATQRASTRRHCASS